MSPTESSVSAGPLAQGLGMLRLDPSRPEHRATVEAALRGGVETVDLGSLTADPEAARAKLELLIRVARATPAFVPGAVRVLVRGELGEAAAALDRLSTLAAEGDALFSWIYLLADPEFALRELDGDHAVLYSRIAQELDALEAAVVRGAISGYGIASAAFAYPKEDPQFLALEPLVRPEADEMRPRGSASEAGSGFASASRSGFASASRSGFASTARSGFAYVEFPFNLYESGAFLARNQLVRAAEGRGGGSETLTLLEAAERLGLHTIARRPFDALTETQLLRLVPYPDHHRLDLDAAVVGTLEVALRLETELGNRAPGEGAPPKWAHRLRANLRHVRDPEQWKEIRRRKIEPDLLPWRERVAGTPDAGPERAYLDAMDALLLAVRLWCEKRGAERNERIRARLVQAVPALRAERDLAALLFRLYRATPGLHTVLVGTRSVAQLASLAGPGAELSADQLEAAFAAGARAIEAALEENIEETAARAETAAAPAALFPKGPSA